MATAGTRATGPSARAGIAIAAMSAATTVAETKAETGGTGESPAGFFIAILHRKLGGPPMPRAVLAFLVKRADKSTPVARPAMRACFTNNGGNREL